MGKPGAKGAGLLRGMPVAVVYLRLFEAGSICSTSTSVRRTLSGTVSACPSTRLPGEEAPAARPRRLAPLGLLARPGPLDRLVLERRLGLLGAQHAVAPLALGLDVLLAQVHRLLHRPLHHPAGDPHPAGRDLALADRELLLDHRHALLAPGAFPLPAPAGLVAVHDLDRPLDLRLRHLGGDQPLAAAGGLGELARVVPAEAAGDDLALDLVLAAFQDRDVPLREAGPDELLDHPAGGLAVERADDGRRHLSVSLYRLFVCRSRGAADV